MAYLYAKNSKTSTAVQPAPMITKIDIPIDSKPINEIVEPSVTTPKACHITFMSYEDYIKGIESMCKQDRMFMERVRSFCNEPVEEDEKDELEQPLSSDKSTSKSKKRSK